MTQSGSEATRAVLPVELTHFIGRERELSALRALARTSRLLTLTGAGGSGKSRLALELAPHIVRDDEEAFAWVELAPLLDPDLVSGAILRALGLRSEGGVTVDAVIDAVRNRTVTLILDNCEHLVEACAEIADALLRACPHVRILATSREALGVAGERAWLVPPLAFAAEDASLETLQQCDAVRLFVDRARDVLPDFELTHQNARAVAAVCARLDGIPLAIELAAARVRHMTPEQIRDRLGDAFALLTTGARTALPRHRTLRAALDWSHDLLPPAARIVLRRLAVFRGGFTLDMVERVAAGDGVDAAGVLDLIGMLADRSLIVVREQDGMARYQLLETMRQYALQRLEAAGEIEHVRARFADAVARLVAETEPAFTTPARQSAFRQLEPELDNIREVLTWTREHAPAQHVALVGRLWWFWFSTRHWVEAHRWIRDALDLDAAAGMSHERAALLFALGALGCLRAEMAQARPLLENAAELAHQLGDGRLEAYANNYIAMSHAAALSPATAAAAIEHAGRAERWLRPHDDLYGLRLSLLLGGMGLQAAGRSDEAVAKMEEAVHIARRFGQDRELAIALQTYATVLLERGDVARARQLAAESLRALRSDQSFLFIARAIDYHALTHESLDAAGAARTLGIGEALRRHIEASRFEHDQRRVDALVARLRTELGDEAFEHAFTEGMAVQPSAAVEEVLRLDSQRAAAAASHPSGTPAPAPVPEPQPESSAVPANAPPPELTTRSADLDVRLLGQLEVSVRGERIRQWPYTKPKELLAYLLLHPHGRTRIDIGGALWPDAAPAQVRNSFHVTMHHLRKTLGHADWVVLEGDRYRLAPGLAIRTDAAEFQERAEGALRPGSPTGDVATIDGLRATLALYRDHLLAGEMAGPWRDEPQDRLRRLYCDVGMKLGALLDDAQDPAAAATVYEAIVACEPLHEPAHRGLLLALTRAGKRAHALRHYERLSNLLEDIELEPEPETAELYERIRSADIVPNG